MPDASLTAGPRFAAALPSSDRGCVTLWVKMWMGAWQEREMWVGEKVLLSGACVGVYVSMCYLARQPPA